MYREAIEYLARNRMPADLRSRFKLPDIPTASYRVFTQSMDDVILNHHADPEILCIMFWGEDTPLNRKAIRNRRSKLTRKIDWTPGRLDELSQMVADGRQMRELMTAFVTDEESINCGLDEIGQEIRKLHDADGRTYTTHNHIRIVCAKGLDDVNPRMPAVRTGWDELDDGVDYGNGN